ncbi:DUF3891 family protein [Schlesneria sp. DSM 10557]|uniref:DUF3891 family protein n=1 Tax=Schlesneria sp. DSM 10557 TaxID=3044399 RepID=UPI0035A0213F
MIVKSVETGWEVVYQAAHALLAGKIATQLRQLPAVHYWPETLAALFEHDDHKTSFGKNVYLTSLGAPKDFTQFRFTAKERAREVSRRIENGYRKHRWIGLLAARHAEELYRSEKISPSLRALIDDEIERRAAILHELGTTKAALESAYAVLQWCDRISLILCQGAIPAMHRRIEIAPLENQRYQMWQRPDNTVAIEPWPFSAKIFVEHVEVRTLQQLIFTSDSELQEHLRACPVEMRTWHFQKTARSNRSH